MLDKVGGPVGAEDGWLDIDGSADGLEEGSVEKEGACVGSLVGIDMDIDMDNEKLFFLLLPLPLLLSLLPRCCKSRNHVVDPNNSTPWRMSIRRRGFILELPNGGRSVVSLMEPSASISTTLDIPCSFPTTAWVEPIATSTRKMILPHQNNTFILDELSFVRRNLSIGHNATPATFKICDSLSVEF